MSRCNAMAAHGMSAVNFCIHNTGMGRSSDGAQIPLYPCSHHLRQTFPLCSDPSVRKFYTNRILPLTVSLYGYIPTHCPLNLQSNAVMSESYGHLLA